MHVPLQTVQKSPEWKFQLAALFITSFFTLPLLNFLSYFLHSLSSILQIPPQYFLKLLLISPTFYSPHRHKRPTSVRDGHTPS